MAVRAIAELQVTGNGARPGQRNLRAAPNVHTKFQVCTDQIGEIVTT